MKLIFSTVVVVLLSALGTGVAALPKPTSQTTKLDGSQIRMVNSSMEKARFRGLPFTSNSNTISSKSDNHDDNKDKKKSKLLERNEIISFAKEHANVVSYITIGCAVAMVVKSTFFNKNKKQDLTRSDMEIIHNLLTEEEEEVLSSSPVVGAEQEVDEQELLQDEWMDQTQTQMHMEDMYPSPESSSYMTPEPANVAPIRRPSSNITPRGVRRVRGGADSAALLERLRIGMYFAAWYALNIVYNIINKKVLNVLPAPLIVGTVQFGIGALYVLLVWAAGLRPVPTLTKEGKSAVSNVGFFHALGQLASMISLGAGPVSFTHIVKALEPFFSAVVSGIYFGKWMNPQVYATLIPVVGGVGYACLKERSFSWLAFSAAMASNLAFALRAVLSKVALQSGADAGSNLTPPNMFGLVTIAAFLMSIPLALVVEGMGFRGLLTTALDSVENNWHFARAVLLSGLFHYLNNEVMYLALGSVHPVTLAVGNTMKRVIIMVASVMVFGNEISVQAGIGSGVGISGVLLYSLTKQYYESLAAKQALEKPKKGPFRLVINKGERVKAPVKVSVPRRKI